MPVYSILKYVPDSGRGEVLNIGVLLLDIEELFFEVKLLRNTERIKAVFPYFVSKDYRFWASMFASKVEKVKKSQLASFPEFAYGRKPFEFSSLTSALFRDPSLAVQLSEERRIRRYASPRTILQDLFSEYVFEESSVGSSYKSDTQVWSNVYLPSLRATNISQHLQPAKVAVGKSEPYKFDHCLKQNSLKILQPLSFELSTGEGMRDKASRWLGTCEALRRSSQVDHLYFLTSGPSHPELYDHYLGALDLISSTTLSSTIYLDGDQERLIQDLVEYIPENDRNDFPAPVSL